MEQMNNEKGQTCPIGSNGQCGCSGCSCGGGCGCGHMHFHRFFLVRIIIALIVAALVFYMGVKVGEMKALFNGGNYGYHRHSEYMMPGYAYPVYNGGATQMMGGTTSGVSGSQLRAAPATGSSASQ